MISTQINGNSVDVPRGSTIYQACALANVYVPTFCHHPDIPPAGKCGICVVKVNGMNFVQSCVTKVTPGMIIETNTPDVKSKAAACLSQISETPFYPLSDEIENLMSYFSTKKPKNRRMAEKTNSIQFDPKLCVGCGRCVRVCRDVQGIGALDEDSHSLSDNDCIGCGQCINVCPTAALSERSSVPDVIKAMAKGKIMIMQTSPSSRVTVGELFGDPPGTVVTGKMVSAARELGFRFVFDTSFGADMTVLEEGSELIERFTSGKNLPLFTSCCPAWVNYVEKMHPELIPNLSTSKSPQMMMGSLIKTYFAKQRGMNPEDMYVVSLMPCSAKKDEILRKQLVGDVDSVLTTREFGSLIRRFNIDWQSLEESHYDPLLAESTPLATMFAVSGGVSEAAIRFAYEEIAHKRLDHLDYTQAGEGIKTSSIYVNGKELKIAVCDGCFNASRLIKEGKLSDFSFVEVMACPMGCINGGGQPKLTRSLALKRAEAIFDLDRKADQKLTSRDNSEARKLYAAFLGKPNMGLSQELLHTHYQPMTTPFIEMKRIVGTLPVVAYGTTTGTAARLSLKMALMLSTLPVSLSTVSPKKLRIVLIICSTYGDGEFPDSVLPFAREIATSSEQLTNLKYAVCALGSKEHPKFCYAGRAIDKLLAKMGAQRLYPVLDLDTSSVDRGEGAFEEWTHHIINALGIKAVPRSFSCRRNQNESDDIVNSALKPLGFDFGVMVSNSLITPSNQAFQLNRYQIKLPIGQTYHSGDVVLILPQNDPETVASVLFELSLSSTDILSIETLPDDVNCIPDRVTISQLLSQYIDLNGIPSRELIRAFMESSKESFSRERLSKVLDTQQRYEDLVRDMSVGEFIIENCRFGSPSIETLVSVCPKITPRRYSIASAPSASARSVEIFVRANIFGNGRHGLCSNFLRTFGLAKVAVRIERGYFSYPERGGPLLMFAFEERVSPMLSLIQHRESLKEEKGNACLFFGSGRKGSYPILETLLADYLERGCLQNLYFAYEREGTNRIFITNQILEAADVVWEYWSNPKTELFYSGPPRGIPDRIKETLLQITVEKGKMDRVAAEKFCERHSFHIEAF